MVLVKIVLVCGDWKFEKNKWLFFVDNSRGCRIFHVELQRSYEDLVCMVYEDFGLDRSIEEIELSYMLSKKMLQNLPEDTPPVIVGNDRQFQSFMKLCKAETIRLCVTIKLSKKVMVNSTNNEEQSKSESDKKRGIYVELQMDDEYRNKRSKSEENYDFQHEDVTEDEEEEERFDYCDDTDGVTSDDDDYTMYGRTNTEEELTSKGDENIGEMSTPSKINELGGVDDFQDIEMSAINVAVGQRYENKMALETRMKILSVVRHFDFDVVKSTPSLYVVKCWVKSCVWRMRASQIGDHPSFHVRVYVPNHTCSITERSRRSRQATYEVLGQLYKDFVGGVEASIKPNHVAIALNKRYHLKVGYWKAHRALRHARDLVRGTPENGYENLPTYLYQIRRANPGSYTRLEVDNQDRFKYLFISFAASINGFQYMRKVVVVDGTFLQGKYKGTLLVAAAQDGNFQIFPIAFAIVDTENDETWEWFFRQLSIVIPDDGGLALISDRHRSIGNAIAKVYPLATRGICTYHMYKNILLKFRGGEIFRMVKKAANAFKISDFNAIFHEIEALNPALHAYLVKANLQYWTRVHFPGDRYNITTTNIAESINRVLSEARSLPIMQLIDEIRLMLTRWFSERRNFASSMRTVLTHGVEKLLVDRVGKSKDMDVQEIDGYHFEVACGENVNVVNLNGKTCTCRQFDIEKLPCVHAIAAAEAKKVSTLHQCHPYYHKNYLCNAYAFPIMPRDRSLPVPDEVESKRCLPPIIRQRPGRPKNKRIKSAVEIALQNKPPRKGHTCSKCNKVGHNCRTCKA